MTAAESVAYIEQTRGLHIAEATFISKVARGQGPKFFKFGRKKTFTAALIDEWLDETLGAPVQTSREFAARQKEKAATVTPIGRARAAKVAPARPAAPEVAPPQRRARKGA